MLTTSSPIDTPVATASTNTAKAATVEASARTALRTEQRVATAHEDRMAKDAANAIAARDAASEIPDPMTSLSTVAVVGAMSSLPAALNMMRNIAMASASGSLTDADRQALQTDYSQLCAKVASSVGSVGAGAQAQTSTSHDDERKDNAENTWRESSDDRRTTLTRTMELPTQTVHYESVDRTTTVQKQTLVSDGHPAQQDPRVDLPTRALHVGTDSYEPVSTRQSFSRPPMPASFGRTETRAETQHSRVEQVAQITQFVQVAQTEHIAPVVAVA